MKSYDITAQGLRIRVEEEGQGDPVLLLHGWGASRKFWRKLLPILGKRHRVISLDWPGHGESDKPDAPYTLPWFSGLLEPILAALQLPSVTLVGQSMGGGIAALFTLDHPDRVRRLVLVSSFIQGQTAFFLKTRLLSLPVIRNVVFWFIRYRWVRRFVAADFTHELRLEDDLVDDISRLTYGSAIDTIRSMLATDLAPRLQELRLPVQIASGEFDRILTPSQQQIQRSGIPGARATTISGSGHCPMMEKPEDLGRIILEFLEATTPAPAARPK